MITNRLQAFGNKLIFFGKNPSQTMRSMGMRLGIDFYVCSDDRKVLEGVIFPYFIRKNEFNHILFIGCDWYTRGYQRKFKGHDYWTLEIEPKRAKWGGAQHIIDGVENISKHFGKGSLDLIICNGVFGWGLDARPNVEKAFASCFECMRKDGVFILGWNDIPERRPFDLQECQSLKSFRPYFFSPLSTSCHLTQTANRHTYNFYLK